MTLPWKKKRSTRNVADGSTKLSKFSLSQRFGGRDTRADSKAVAPDPCEKVECLVPSPCISGQQPYLLSSTSTQERSFGSGDVTLNTLPGTSPCSLPLPLKQNPSSVSDQIYNSSGIADDLLTAAAENVFDQICCYEHSVVDEQIKPTVMLWCYAMIYLRKKLNQCTTKNLSRSFAICLIFYVFYMYMMCALRK